MTWSIVARDPAGALGVAVASRFFAVGALCPAVRTGRGALSTQALINPLYAREALALLDAGVAPAEIVQRLTSADAGREARQLHVIDTAGTSAAPMGGGSTSGGGDRARSGNFLAGHTVAGPPVVAANPRASAAAANHPG